MGGGRLYAVSEAENCRTHSAIYGGPGDRLVSGDRSAVGSASLTVEAFVRLTAAHFVLWALMLSCPPLLGLAKHVPYLMFFGSLDCIGAAVSYALCLQLAMLTCNPDCLVRYIAGACNHPGSFYNFVLFTCCEIIVPILWVVY